MRLVVVSRGEPIHVQAVGLCTVSTQLLGQGPVPVAEGSHQIAAVLHLKLIGAGTHGDAPCSRACSGPRHVAEQVNWFLYLDGHLLHLAGLLQAQAGECHTRRRGTVLGLLLEGRTTGG